MSALFDTPFTWGDDEAVATPATAAATREIRAEAPVSKPAAAPVATVADVALQPGSEAAVANAATGRATPEDGSFPGFHAPVDWSVAGVASVAAAPVSQSRAPSHATPVATPQTAVFCGVEAEFLGGVAGVASVAAWTAGVSRMRAPEPPIACVTWALVVQDARAFLRMWGDDAVKAGWTTLEVFGANANPAARRLDTLGLVVLLQGRTVQSLDSEMALIGSGSSMTVFRRSLVAPGGVALWDLAKRDDAGVGRWEGPGDTAFSGTPDLPSLSTGMGGEHENPALRRATGGRW